MGKLGFRTGLRFGSGAAALAMLGACDGIGEPEGSHRPLVEVSETRAIVGFQSRAGAASDPAEAALECTAVEGVGAPYPMRVWVRLGPAPQAAIERTETGEWAAAERRIPNALAFVIGGRAYETEERALTRSAAGELVFSGQMPAYDTLFEALARARFVQITIGEERRTLSVAAWRKELIEAAERCERFVLAWQFTR